MGLGLPESYTLKPNAMPAYFDAMLDAQPPERFSVKFLERLGFTSTNDRLLIAILKDLGFLSRDGVPQPRYFEFLDRTRSKQVVAEGIRESFSDLFAINAKANEMTLDDVRNKMRTIFAGQKTNLVIGNIAKTFNQLLRLRRSLFDRRHELGHFRRHSRQHGVGQSHSEFLGEIPQHCDARRRSREGRCRANWHKHSGLDSPGRVATFR